MAISFSPLTAETLPAVQQLLLPFWERDWAPEFSDRLFRWRFLGRQDGESILAMDGERCVAMIDSWCRQYMINGERVDVRELGDWYSLPEVRGVGLQPMWMMMKKPQPILSIGGTSATQALLPRLGWKPLPQVVNYTLALSSGVIAQRPLNRLGLPGKTTFIKLAHKLSFPVRRVHRQPAPAGNATVSEYDASAAAPLVRPPADAYALASLMGQKELDWLYSAPEEMGEFVSLVFSVEDEPVGLSVSRLYKLEHVDEAAILQIQSSTVSADMYKWMVSETAALLADRGARSIRCKTSCPNVAEALSSVGFRQRAANQTVWWSRDQEAPQGNILLSMFRADDGILPYPK